MAVPAGAMGMAMATEVAGAAKVTNGVAAVIAVVPGSGTIANGSVRNADHGPRADRLSSLLAALRAGDNLEDIGHRHSLVSASATGRTEVFVKGHAQIVRGVGRKGKPRRPYRSPVSRREAVA